MQSVVFVGRLAAEPQVSDDLRKAAFRLIENRGQDLQGKDRVVGVNCVSWIKGLNERVIAKGLVTGCEVVAAGVFVDNAYKGRDGAQRTAKELVIRSLTVLDWADATESADALPSAA